MAQKEYIKYLYETEEKSLREIAKITNLCFQTVQKYAYEDNWNEDALPSIHPERYPVLGEYLPVIDKWLEEDRKAPRKQRHTMQRIYRRLQEEYGYAGGYGSIKKYVNKKKRSTAEQQGYLPLTHPPGEAQIDFGEFVYDDAQGRRQTGYALTVSFPYSNMGFTQAFPAQNQECLLEGMKRIFAHIGGVPKRVRADNMTTAVAQVLAGGDRVLAEGFARFKLHYRFAAEFCNPAAGHEKGNVENKVGYSRRNFFVPIPVITDFSIFNEQLFKLCEKDGEREHYQRHIPLRELWEEEKNQLLNLPEHEFLVFRYQALRVSKYGFTVIDTNKYGLSPAYSGEIVQAKIFYDQVEFYHDHHLLKRYRRSYGSEQEILDWTQYLPTLVRKPGAATHTRFFDQMPKLWQEHLRQTQGKERKSALLLLTEIVQDGNASLCEDALTLAGECGRLDADSIRQCYYMIAKKEYHPQPLRILTPAPLLDYHPSLQPYDSLTGGARYE